MSDRHPPPYYPAGTLLRGGTVRHRTWAIVHGYVSTRSGPRAVLALRYRRNGPDVRTFRLSATFLRSPLSGWEAV